MLDKHLIAKTEPKALDANIVRFGDYRISVLADRLFRIEKDKTGAFCDDATQCVWFRNAEKQKFSVDEGKSYVSIKTDKVTLVVYKTFSKSYVLIDGNKRPLTNEGNLKGTARTLDNYRGNEHEWEHIKLKMDDGVCSRTGVSVLDDKKSLLLLQNGEVAKRPSEEIDTYVFAYGKDYRGAVKALFDITGHTPLIPRFALGNWWSRYYAYTDKQYLHLMDKFIDNEIPITVATIDMDWHYSSDMVKEFSLTEEQVKNSKFYGKADFGWTGYTWNKHLFPNHKETLKKIHEKNLHITLNLHPSDGIRFYEECYPEMAKAMGIDPETKQCVEFDMTNTEFINNYFKLVHKPHEHDGVNFWWIDWQQGTETKMAGLDPLWMLNHYHFLDNGLEQKEPLILSRYAGVGAHRYPLGFSGDTIVEWCSLDFVPYFTANATNVGYTWWSHDIGAHMFGIKDDEMYLRYVQFGAFSPINRLHSTLHEMFSKEPWLYENGIDKLAKEYLVLRHRMIPYIYSAGFRTHKFGDALIEPMYYAYPDEENAYKFRNQYLFGGDVMVCPVTKHSEYKNMTPMDVWVPEGRWTDIFTGTEYDGGKVIRMVRPLDSIPVLAHEGATFILSGDRHVGNDSSIPSKIEVQIFNGNGKFELYEGDDEKSCKTQFVNIKEDGKQITEITFEGDSSVLTKERKFRLEYKNIVTGDVKVTKDGKEIEADVDDNGYVSVEFVFDTKSEYRIEVSYKERSEMEKIHAMMAYAVGKMQLVNDDRRKLYDALLETKTKDEYEEVVRRSGLASAYAERLLEFVK